MTLSLYDDCSLAYLKARHAITRQITWHRRHHGGDPDELQGEAHLAFMDAYHSYDPTRGTTFPTWAATKVRGRLLDYSRTQARRAARLPLCGDDALDELEDTYDFEECGEDGDELIRAALGNVPDVLVTAATINEYDRPVSVRLAVLEYFRSLGWGVSRLAEAFSAVREVI